MYGQQNQQQRPPRKECTGRVWPARKRTSPNSPHFTGEIALPGGHVMRVSVWESTDRQGTFNGFSLKLSEDTRQGNGYNGQQQSQAVGYAPQAQQGPQQPYAPPQSYGPGDEGYVPGFDD